MANRSRRRERPDPEAEDRAWADFSQAFRGSVLPKLLGSSVNLMVFDGEDGIDIKYAAELGVMLLLGKPLVLCVMSGSEIPAGLLRAADEVVEVDPDMGIVSQDRVAAAMRRIAVRLNEAEGGM